MTYLIKRNTQALHAHARQLSPIRTQLLVVVALRHLLEALLAGGLLAEGDQHDVARVQGRDDLLPLGQLQAVRPERLVRFVVEVLLDRLEQRGNLRRQLVERDRALGARVAARVADYRVGRVLGAELESQGHALHFPVGKFKTRSAGLRG